MELPIGVGRTVSGVSSVLLVIATTSSFGVLCAVTVAGFVVAREWWWNRDRHRRVIAMLQLERESRGASRLRFDPMVIQLCEIRALPEVFEPIGP